MTFDRARVRQLARDAWGLMDADAFNNIAVDQCIATIEAAILAAARELLGEEPSAEMQIAGYEAFVHARVSQHNCESAVYRAMAAARLAQIGEE